MTRERARPAACACQARYPTGTAATAPQSATPVNSLVRRQLAQRQLPRRRQRRLRARRQDRRRTRQPQRPQRLGPRRRRSTIRRPRVQQRPLERRRPLIPQPHVVSHRPSLPAPAAPQGCDARAKIAACAAKPRRHRSPRNPHHLGDLRGRHLLELVQHEHRPQRLLHLVQHAVQQLAHPLLIGQSFGRGQVLDLLGGLVLGHLAPARGSPAGVGRLVEGDAEEEALLGAQPDVVQAAGGDDERPLHLVVNLGFGRPRIPQHARHEVDVRIDQLAQARLAGAGGRRARALGVAGLAPCRRPARGIR